MATRRIFSKSSNMVWIEVGATAWSRIPIRTKTEMADGLEATAGVVAKIAEDARVKTMPPVEIVCECWQDHVGMVNGLVTHLLKSGNEFMGVRLPATSATCSDLDLLRGIIVHEFAHCFWYFERIAEAQPRATFSFTDFDPTDNTEDESRMANFADWFGSADCAKPLLHNDPRLNALDKRMLVLMDDLPLIDPVHVFKGSKWCIHDDVWNHLQVLRDRPGGKRPGLVPERIHTDR